MMSARSTPNLQPVPAPPVRDASSLRASSSKSGPGHEKFPSWPVAAAADTPAVLRGPPTGGSSRSKSWTDHTEYPKEQPLTYTRPYMKRQHHSPTTNKQLKTVMERCEKLGPEVFDPRRYGVLPCVDREGKALGDLDYAVPSPPERDAPALTQADLEAYLHHKQPSYAQSEGYHSYVSDLGETPFLDRLRRDSEARAGGSGRDSVVTTSSGSASSSETLKWHGSLSDVSTHSHRHQHQLIAHSARVQTPQRHHSESVLYIDSQQQQQQQQQRKLFPVSTYTVQPHHQHQPSVADRVSELERHHTRQSQRYTYLDPEKKHRVSDPTLKAIQKKALLSFYERHHSSWRSEPQLAVPQAPQPAPPPRPQAQAPSRRASCASDYAGSLRRGPVIVGPAICVDDWVPERPPKNPALRCGARGGSPPPPSPPPVSDVEVYSSDEPLPPPPDELVWAPPPLPPPPLLPRSARHNQSMRAHISASKASYLAARREREATVCDTGSYKRTMSPPGDLCTSRLQVVRRASITEPKPLPDVISTSTTITPPASPSTSSSPQPLQLMQRTEVTLRVNAATSDAGCQTEHEEIPTRRKLQEEIECERLQQDLADHLAASDRLKCILVPGPEHRKPTDYVSGLFKVEMTTRPRHTACSTPPASPQPDATTSKTKFLSSLCHGAGADLARKKEELVSRLARKLEVLRGEARAVAEERAVNDELGAEVARLVSRSARPAEAAKFRLHVDEVGHITALLLGLSGRLARAENALMSPCDNPAERNTLQDKRDKLAAQLQEAKQLKDSIDRRSRHVANMLAQYLQHDQYKDYDHFINMKAKLIMDARDVADKIKLGEEQLQALKDTLADV